jgi:hypothetical protein
MAVDPQSFSERDRQTIRDCFVDDRSGLPPGLAKNDLGSKGSEGVSQVALASNGLCGRHAKV